MTNPAEHVNPAPANVDPLAGIEVPPVLEGVIDGLFVRMAEGHLTQREVDLIAMGVEMVDARRARMGQAAGVTATAAEAAVAAAPATPPAEKAEAKKSNIMDAYPSLFSYDWGGESAGGFNSGSAAGERLYTELNDENTQLPDIGVPSDIVDRESVTPGKVKIPREVVGFSVIPPDHAAELRPHMDLPEDTNPNLDLVTFEYSVMGDISSQDGSGKPEIDAVNAQVTLPYDVADRLAAAVQKNPRVAREMVAKALLADVERAKGTADEQRAIQMSRALSSRFKLVTDGMDRRPGAHMMLLSDMPGHGTPQDDGYTRRQLPLGSQAGSAPASAAPTLPGGLIGKGVGALMNRRRPQ